MQSDIKELLERYPWLKITTTIEEYINPQYYNEILKDYIFEEKTDLEYFRNWIKEKDNIQPNILELGCGSGRVTDVLLEEQKDYNNLTLLDLSKQMLKYCETKYKNIKKINYVNSDTIEYLKNTNEKYDIVYSLWSFSHSVHQILHQRGLENGSKYVEIAIEKFIRENINKNGKFFLIHFDSLSDEQKILIQQWKKVYKTFENNKIQSPSQILIHNLFEKLEKQSVINFSEKHYVGKEIIYSNVNEALEIFMNFHMESYFNESKQVEQVINELTEYFKKYTYPDGTIRIKPGCFIYEVTKNE